MEFIEAWKTIRELCDNAIWLQRDQERLAEALGVIEELIVNLSHQPMQSGPSGNM